MYKQVLIPAAALLLYGSASAWKIEGRISGVADKDSVTVRLFQFVGNSGRDIQLCGIENGRFNFVHTPLPAPMVMMSIQSSTGKWINDLWMTDSTEIRISGTADGEWTVTSNEPEQAIQTELQGVDLSDLDSLIGSAEGYDRYRDSVWRVSVERLWPVYSKYPNSRAMLNDLNFYVGVGAVPREKMQWIYDRLTPEMRGTLEGEALAVAIDPPHRPQVGERFADFTATDTTGRVHKLSDWAGRGQKYVLLDLWSIGCGGCYAAFPKMKEIYARYGDRLEIVGISLDTAKDRWKRAIRWQQLPWVNLSDGKGTYAGAGVLYKSHVMPTYVLIDPQGRIVERWYPGQGDFQNRLVEPYLERE